MLRFVLESAVDKDSNVVRIKIVISLNMKISEIENHFSLMLFTIVIFLLTRQVPFSSLSWLMNAALIVFLAYESRRNIKNQKIIKIAVILLTAYFIGSALANEIEDALRFYLISSLIIIAYGLVGRREYINIFLIMMIIQSVVLIVLQIYMLINFEGLNYAMVRSLVGDKGWGDIYTSNGILYKIQIKGNALIPFAAMVSLIYLSGRTRINVFIILMTGLIFAGNFAFLIGIGLFICGYFFIKYAVNYLKISFLLVVVMLGIAASISWIGDVIELKSENSNPIRVEQSKILAYDLSNTQILFGSGFGSEISAVGQYRDYTGSRYFELQALYFLNQMGYPLFSGYVLFNALLAWLYLRNKMVLLAYSSYLIYGFFNPYIFDTNHIIAILVCVSLKRHYDEKCICCFGDIQPRGKVGL